MRRATLSALVTIAVLALPAAGWAKVRVASGATPGDPWEESNRRVFAMNQRLDRLLIGPLSRLTAGLTPGPVGRAIHNFVVNLHESVVIINDVLQARPGPAFKSVFRLLVNSTVGLLGAIDVAKALGEPAHKNGFGDTLGRWGVGPGPYVVLPVLGPATVRDLFGSVADDVAVPIRVIDFPYQIEVDITVSVVGDLNERSEVAKDLDALLSGAADPYATLRSSYLQAREAQIRGEKALPPLPDIEDVTPPPAPAVAPGPGTPGSSASPEPPAAAAPPNPGALEPATAPTPDSPATSASLVPDAPSASEQPGSFQIQSGQQGGHADGQGSDGYEAVHQALHLPIASLLQGD